jgi:hypothetical protein
MQNSGMRGRLPVLMRMASASSSVIVPSASSATTSCGPFSRAAPRTTRTPWLSSSSQMLPFSLLVMPWSRAARASSSMRGTVSARPIPSSRRAKDMAPPVAIMALDGMQSHR